MLRLRNYLILLIFFIWETWATGPFTCPKRAQWASYWTTKWQQGKATDRLNSTLLTSNICVFFFPLAHLSALESNSILTLPGVNANITGERLSSQECVPFWTPAASLGLLNHWPTSSKVWGFPRSPPRVLWFAEPTHKTQKSTLPTIISVL